MSYYAMCEGDVVFFGEVSEEKSKTILEMLTKVFGYAYKESMREDDRFVFVVESGWANYSDYVLETLCELTKIAPIKRGEVEFIGEDWNFWRFLYKDGKWIEQEGRVVYD